MGMSQTGEHGFLLHIWQLRYSGYEGDVPILILFFSSSRLKVKPYGGGNLGFELLW